MKIACIYFDINSVGGIASETVNYKLAARAMGHAFDIIRCTKKVRQTPELWPRQVRIRGGDTTIGCDGECSHHPNQIKETIRWLEFHYDALFFIHPCPRPTKAYGSEPHWLPMYTDCKLPKVMKFCDGYVSSYPWVMDAVPHVNAYFAAKPTDKISLDAVGLTESIPLAIPFHPTHTYPHARSTPERSVMWYAQWKDIKGIKPFIAAVPEISKIANVEMFSCGIRYYQLRSTDDWRQAVRHDFFKGYHGNGLADYFGEITQKTLYGNIARTWAAVCLQGMSKRVKHSHYREGSYQYTEMEALWYGAYPVVAEQVAKSAIPSECIITISDDADSEEIATTIEAGSPTALRDNPKAYGLAQDFILDVHSAEKGLTTIIESLGGRA